jgi:hypothetical protein
VAGVDFYFNLVGVHAVHSSGVDSGEHEPEPVKSEPLVQAGIL